MQPPTWFERFDWLVIAGVCAVLVGGLVMLGGVFGYALGYGLRDDGGSTAVTAETTQPAALPTSCALFTETNERINGDPRNNTPLGVKEQLLTLWDKACR